MKLAFYKAAAGGVVDRLIDTFSGRDGYSHVELVFSNGAFFSSSSRDGGTRFKFIRPDPASWDLVDVPMDDVAESLVRRFCNEQAGKKYDWLGVFGFVLPTRPEQGHWFCSEVCLAALQQCGFLAGCRPWKVSPNTLKLMFDTRPERREGMNHGGTEGTEAARS